MTLRGLKNLRLKVFETYEFFVSVIVFVEHRAFEWVADVAERLWIVFRRCFDGYSVRQWVQTIRDVFKVALSTETREKVNRCGVRFYSSRILSRPSLCRCGGVFPSRAVQDEDLV